MGKVEFKLDPAGVREMLNWQSVQDMTQEIGNGVADRANAASGIAGGFAADTRAGEKRAHTFVKPVEANAYYHNLKHNTLLEALR